MALTNRLMFAGRLTHAAVRTLDWLAERRFLREGALSISAPAKEEKKTRTSTCAAMCT